MTWPGAARRRTDQGRRERRLGAVDLVVDGLERGVDGLGMGLVGGADGGLKLFLERHVERVQDLGRRLPVADAVGGERVELAFHQSRELQVDDVGEVLGEQVVDLLADLGRVEAAFELLGVAARLNRFNDGAIGRRPADAVLLEGAHEARLGEARRWFGEVLLGIDRLRIEVFVLAQLGEDCARLRTLGRRAAFELRGNLS